MDVDAAFDKKLIGQRIKAHREALGLTQDELGSRIGTNGNNISNYEIGCSSPNLERFYRLCIALNVSADALLGRQYPDYDDAEYRQLLKLRQMSEKEKAAAGVILSALQDFIRGGD